MSLWYLYIHFASFCIFKIYFENVLKASSCVFSEVFEGGPAALSLSLVPHGTWAGLYAVPFLVTIAITIKALLIIYLCQVFLIFTNQHFLRASHYFFCLQTPKSPNDARFWSYYMICFSSFTILFFLKKCLLCWKQYSVFFNWYYISNP